MITLVQMPFSDIERPSPGLGLLKAALMRDGQDVEVVYGNLLFTQWMGIHVSSLPLRLWATSLIGEWIFAKAAFPDFSPPDDQYLHECVAPFARLYRDGDSSSLVDGIIGELRRLREAAPVFIDQITRDILKKRPMLVGCSSNYSQQTASLALLKRVRELDPEVVTMIGGANVEGAMGATVVRTFPWIDAICSGEGDEVIVPLCRSLIRRGRAGLEESLPEGIVTRRAVLDGDSTDGGVSRSTATDLDALPFPDYDDYFETLTKFPDSDRRLLHCVLVMETSRGCWWGEKQPCMFCGLNRGRQGYRFKKPERVRFELESLGARYGVKEFVMTDNVTPPEYFESLFPQLERMGAPYTLFYETRPVLSREKARQLSAAGVRHIQAGLESLHDELLVLMNKGTSVLHNVALLKHARTYGLTVGWNLLTGFPGELDEWHFETAEWLPLIHHLQPPVSLHGVTLQRFSLYLEDPRRYGLEPIPYNSYDVIYPVASSVIHDIAYYFRDASWPEYYPEMNRRTPGVSRLMEEVEEWRNVYWSSYPPQLTVRELDSETLGFMDSRFYGESRETTVCGIEAEIYRMIEDPIDRATLLTRLEEKGIRESSSVLEEALKELEAARLILCRSNRILSLATPDPCRPVVSMESRMGRDEVEEDFRRYLSKLTRGQDSKSG